jgi:spermidine dehydrogenase
MNDKELGMGLKITRRDFINGVGVGVAAGASLLDWGIASAQTPAYPPALTGLRGSHEGAYEAAHALRDGTLRATPTATGETYDLVVVGAGISGLAAAWFFRQRTGSGARILILDNHDDFGGHARRNEFTVARRNLIAYGGSMSIDTPSLYSREARGLMAALGIDPPALARKAEDRGLYDRLGLKSGVFFDRETFGADRLVVGALGDGATAEDWARFLEPSPLSSLAKADIARIQTAGTDYLPGLSPAEKKERLWRISYRDFLLSIVKADPGVVPYYQSRTHGYYGVGIDAVPALDCWAMSYPGFKGMGLEKGPGGYLSLTAAGFVAHDTSDYEFHYPDGNASITRLLVRSLMPEAVPGRDAEDIVTARIDYARLDRSSNSARLRLNSTAVGAKQLGAEVDVTYMRGGRAESVRAKSCVLACWHAVIPYLCPDLPSAQKEALASAAKVPLVYSSVAIRDWRSLARLQVHRVSTPGMFHTSMGLDRPVSLGGYDFPKSPDEPAVLHMFRTPCRPGLPARDQHRAGQRELFMQSFGIFERAIRDQLGRVLGAGGFDPARDIAGITVNRWPHGYAYEYNPLFDPRHAPGQEPCVTARQRLGRIAIANCDAAAYAYADAAIDQGYRAVSELAS